MITNIGATLSLFFFRKHGYKSVLILAFAQKQKKFV